MFQRVSFLQPDLEFCCNIYEASLKLIASCLQWASFKESGRNVHDYLL